MAEQILCMGKPLWDVTFSGDEQFLAKHGLELNGVCDADENRFEELRSALFATYKAPNVEVGGGSCQNTARTIQWLLSDYPNTVTFMGAIGKDSNGVIMKKQAEEIGMSGVFQVVDDGTPTGSCLVILNGVNRSLVAHIAAADKFEVEHLDKNWNFAESAKIVYVEGFFLLACFKAAMKLAKHVASHPEKRFLLNLSAEFIVEGHIDLLQKIMPFVDILIGNGDETACFGIKLGFGENLTEIAKSISAMEKARVEPGRAVIVTRGGSDPIIAAVSPNKVISCQVAALKPDQNIVDTNGAGDAFVGGFIAQMARGKALEDCLRSGSNTAAIVIQQIGCNFPANESKPNLDQLCKY